MKIREGGEKRRRKKGKGKVGKRKEEKREIVVKGDGCIRRRMVFLL
jgi:hypothetical protein